MKLGCVCWLFDDTALGHGPPYEDEIRAVGELGFEGTELILETPDDLKNYWSQKRIDDLNRLCKSYKLTVSEFVVYQEMVGGLASLDPFSKEQALEFWEIGCKMAVQFDAEVVNMVSPWPAGMTSPNYYLPFYFYYYGKGVQKIEPKFKLNLPEDFDWNAYWENYIDSVSQCLDIAKGHGLRFAIENHSNVMSGYVDSLLRVFDRIPDPALGANLDMRWAYTNREDVPWSIYKLGKERLFSTHCGDGDGLAGYMLPVGMGTLDWEGIMRALIDVDYQGFFTFEWGGYADPIRYAKEALAFTRDLIARVS